MDSDPTEPREPMQEVYRNPYETPNPYFGDAPPPPPPGQKRPWLIIALICMICLVLVLGGVLFTVLAQHNQKSSTGATSTHTPTFTPTPTLHPGELSKTPLIEQDSQGNHLCYVVTSDESGVFATLSNPNANIVYRDCMTFIGQGQGGGYYSTTPMNLAPGDALQCEGWGTDNTSWKVEAPYNDLPTITMCHDLAQVVPPTQG